MFFLGILFDDEEPPPLDEFEHSILPKNIQTGYFSGGQGLFDDNDEDEPFWGQPNKSTEYADKQISDQPKKHASKVLYDIMLKLFTLNYIGLPFKSKR